LIAKLPPAHRDKVLKLAPDRELGKAEVSKLIKQVLFDDRRERAKQLPTTGRDQDILLGDMNILLEKLADKSVDLFLTDPTYNDIQAYVRLAELAAAKLKPGGLCLAYSGQMYLPQVLAGMAGHLEYWWTLALHIWDGATAIYPRAIQARWKPIVAFAKPPLGAANQWLTDLLEGGGRDKRFHEWGQAESEAVYLIEHLTEPGQLVVDPYAGGGAFLAAAKILGRRWLATERDEGTVLIARSRLAAMDPAYQ
jgi:hypothetical protein